MRRLLREQGGSQLVEFAFVAPILLFMVLLIPILGMTVRAWVVVEAAAREGARELAISGNQDAARQRAEKEIMELGGLPTKDSEGNVLFDSTRDITVTPNLQQGGLSYAEVVVTYRQPTFLPKLFQLVGSNQELGTHFLLQGRARFLPELRPTVR